MSQVSPDIQAREEGKTLDLLQFALDRAGVDRRSYAIAPSGDSFEAEERVCLVGGDGARQVFFQERGCRRTMGEFQALNDAGRYFFGYLTDSTSFFRYREEWEAESGQFFSMMP